MKTQKMSFQKLLCFKNKFNLLSLDVVCILIAVVFSCILLEYAVVVPSQDLINVCESALYEYIENPSNYSPPTNISIILEENSVVAAIPRAFIYLIATQKENQTYQITTHIRFGSFLLSYFFGFTFRVIFVYIAIEFLLYTFITIAKTLFKITKNLFKNISKKILKFKDDLECKRKQNGMKDYEDPKLQEIYQLGYNIGRADGIAEGTRIAKSDLDVPFT